MISSWFIRTCLGVFLSATAVFAIRPMITYRALELGASTGEIGVLAASYAMISLLIAIPAGRRIDRIGEPWFIVAGAVLMASMSFWLATSGSVVSLGIAQAFLGAGQILGLIAIQALIANCGPPATRDARFGMFSVVASLGHIVGPALGGLVGSGAGGSRAVFVTGGTVMLIAIVNALSLQRWPPPHNERSSGGPAWSEPFLRAVVKVLGIRSMPQAMIASVTVLVTIDLLVAYLPAYGEAYGISVATVGILLSVRAVASALSRLSMVVLIDAFGRKRVLVMSLVLPAVSLALVPVFPAVAALYVLMAIAGFGLGLGQPMSTAWVASAAPVEARGMALGVRLSGNRLGQVVLPAAIGAVGGAAGVTAIFVVLGALLGGSSGVVLTADFADDRPG